MNRNIRVFVYGTLKKGYHNHCLLKNAIQEKDFKLSNYDMYTNGCFPMIVEGNNTIYGESYLVDFDTLMKLDQLEGVPHLYIRKFIIDNDKRQGYIYIYNNDISTYEKISSGKFI